MPKAEPWATTKPMPKAWFRQPSHAGDRDYSGTCAYYTLTPNQLGDHKTANLGEAVIAIAIAIGIGIGIGIAIAIAIDIGRRHSHIHNFSQ